MDERVRKWLDEDYEMTREEAQAIRDGGPRACACLGAPVALRDVAGAPCYCALMWMKVERVLGPADAQEGKPE